MRFWNDKSRSSASLPSSAQKKRHFEQRKNTKNLTKPFAALALLTPLAFAGCGGGSNNGPQTPNIDANIDANIANQSFLGLLSGGTSIVSFRGNAATSSTARTVSGLPAGVSLRGIDARVTPRTTPNPQTVAGDNGVSAIYVLGTNDQLYTLNFAGTGAVVATAVGTPAVFTNFALAQGGFNLTSGAASRIGTFNSSNVIDVTVAIS